MSTAGVASSCIRRNKTKDEKQEEFRLRLFMTIKKMNLNEKKNPYNLHKTCGSKAFSFLWDIKYWVCQNTVKIVNEEKQTYKYVRLKFGIWLHINSTLWANNLISAFSHSVVLYIWKQSSSNYKYDSSRKLTTSWCTIWPKVCGQTVATKRKHTIV